MSQLTNQIAVVTGAGRGIGRAIALKFAAHGADIVAVDLKTEFVQETVAEIGTLGRKAWAVRRRRGGCRQRGGRRRENFDGAGHAGHSGEQRRRHASDGLLMRMSDADWDAVLDTT